tara:strand:- start:339 stop:554 length:216 start_codon:yes stop_codon:yes gene_type:complete
MAAFVRIFAQKVTACPSPIAGTGYVSLLLFASLCACCSQFCPSNSVTLIDAALVSRQLTFISMPSGFERGV